MSMREESLLREIENNPKVTIILLNYNGWEDAIECLESVYKITYPNWELILVDNGSVDGSVSKIKEWAVGKISVESKFFEYDAERKPIEYVEELFYDEEAAGVTVSKKEKEGDMLLPHQKLSIIRIEKNRGFTGGNNIGIEYILKERKTDYILLLSNDTVVDKEFLGELVKVGESDERIGVVGPKIYYYNYKGRSDVINFAGAAITLWNLKEIRYGCGEIDKGQLDKKAEIDKIEGSCILIKNKLFKEVGLLDEKFFGYCEDTDFCMRATKEGFKLLYVPKAIIWHKVAATFGLGRDNPFKVYLMTRNRFLFIKKNANKNDIYKFLIYFLFYDFWFSSGVWLIYHKNFKVFLAFLRGAKDGFKFMINKT